MFSYINGIFTDLDEEQVVLDVNGIGYGIYTSAQTINTLPAIGCEVKLYTYLYVREDMLCLYGFITKTELNTFKLLITVNGIGPKSALAVLSLFNINELHTAILTEDIKSIAKTPGIGNKTAQRLIIELRDKLDFDYLTEGDISSNIIKVSSIKTDAIQALTSLGYTSAEATKAVNSIEIAENMDIEDVLKVALKKISFL